MKYKTTKSSWIDFAAIKQNVSFKTILLHYSLIETFKTKEEKLIGPCPIHKGDSKTAFHIDLQKNIYKCFTRCKSLGFKGGGNIIDFVADMEELGHSKEGIKESAGSMAGALHRQKRENRLSGSTRGTARHQRRPYNRYRQP